MFSKFARCYAYLCFFVIGCGFSNLRGISANDKTDYESDVDTNNEDVMPDNHMNSTTFAEIQRFVLQTAESLKNMDTYTYITIFGFLLLISVIVGLIIYICKLVSR